MSTCSILRSGKARPILRRSSLSRRTSTGSVSLGLTGTPGVNLWLSSNESRVEKLFVCPLWGVADKHSRCSKRFAKSRTALVILVSMAYFWPDDGAAWWASSRIKRDPARNGPRRLRNPDAYDSSISRRCDTRSRGWVCHGLTPKPRSKRTFVT
jgi:hypothetical protein